MQLQLEKNSKSPYYAQVTEGICRAIVDGRLGPHEKLPTQAELARTLKLNRLTVHRGYGELRKRGIINQRRGAGSFVSADAHRILGVRQRRRLRNVAFAFSVGSEDEASPQFEYPVQDLLRGLTEPFGGAHVNLVNFPIVERAGALSSGVVSRLDSFDAVISHSHLSGSGTSLAFIRECLRRNMPCVGLWYESPFPDVPSVLYDRRQAAYLATDHLVQCGFRTIGYVGSFEGYSAERKTAGFLSVLREHRLSLDARFHLQAEPRPGDAYAAVTRAIQRGDLPDAFFVDNDTKAMEVVTVQAHWGL